MSIPSTTDEIDFVATRTLELMGGRTLALATMTAAHMRMAARWNQDTDTIGRILRAHLFVEHYLTEYLQATNPALGDLDEARVTFNQKVSLLKTDGSSVLVGGLRRLNKIRNRLAHNLQATVTDEDAALFLSMPLFRAVREARKHGAEEQLSDAPLAVFEHFAYFASQLLSEPSSPFAKAMDQAKAEWTQGQRQN